VSQEPTLYAGTVRFNILLGAIKPESEVMEEEIEKACRDANILDFIQSLPKYVDHRLIYALLLISFRIVASIPKLAGKDLNFLVDKNVRYSYQSCLR
jgi:ABC-type transport system involved in Fe-S cluster assembly fused permease/ATPase subunit